MVNRQQRLSATADHLSDHERISRLENRVDEHSQWISRIIGFGLGISSAIGIAATLAAFWQR